MNTLKAAIAVTVALLAVQSPQAQELRAGFDPTSALPSVSLPQRTPSLSPPTTQRTQSPSASTDVTRTGRTRLATDMKTAPSGALQAAAAASNTVQSQQSSPQESKYRAGMVIYGNAKAFDGHTMLVDGHAVRLNGVEAPGLAQTCSTQAGTAWKCGQRAFDRLSGLVRVGKVRCVVDATAGHGAAATCSASQTRDIGAFLVSEGLALPNPHSAGRYNTEAVAAMKARRGLWIGPFTDPSKWRNGKR